MRKQIRKLDDFYSEIPLQKLVILHELEKIPFFFFIQKLRLIILFSHLLLLPGTTSCTMTVQPV